jgi:hypothetical protein
VLDILLQLVDAREGEKNERNVQTEKEKQDDS